MRGLEDVVRARGLTALRPLAGGLEFETWTAVDPSGGVVALRASAGGRFRSNANDPDVDTRALLRREERIVRHVAAAGLPLAEPVALVLGEPDVLISHYVPDDGRGVDQVGLGALLARLHRIPAPALTRAVDVLPQRVTRRWHEVAALVPDLPPVPTGLRRPLVGRPTTSLLHLDVRAPNLRCVDGDVRALLDWSNALVGDPALELARLEEFAPLPGNGLDLPAIRAGYGPVPAHESYLVYQLDAAVMLALVFLSEAPDETLAAQAVARLRVLADRWAATA